MTADDLNTLSAICSRSPKGVDAFLASLYIARPGAPILARKRFGYFVERKGADIDGAARGADLEVSITNLGKLMAIAGFGKELRKLRKLHESNPPANPRLRVPSELWVVAAESVNAAEHPDVQALACLRLLQPNLLLKSRPWVPSLAHQRLSELLVEHPSLMHPSILWNASGAHQSGYQALPMAHSIALVAMSSLPSALHGFSKTQLLAFSTHPAVAVGLKGRAPIIEGQSNSLSQGQGLTVCELLGKLHNPRIALVASILRIDRVRHEVLGGAGLFGTTAAGKAGLQHQLASCFTTAWTQPPAEATDIMASFLSEFKSAPMVPAGSARLSCLRFVGRIFIETKWVPGATASRIRDTPDPVERFQRLLERLVDTGLAESRKIAGHMVLRELFPLANESGVFSSELGHADVETANRFIHAWLELGVDYQEMKARVRYSQNGDGSSWRAAIGLIDTHRDMSEIIERSRAPSADDAPAPRRRSNAI